MKKILSVLATMMLSGVVSTNISACNPNPNVEPLTFDNVYNPTAPYKSFYNGVIVGFQIALYKPEGGAPIESIIIFESEYNKFKDKLQNFFVKQILKVNKVKVLLLN